MQKTFEILQKFGLIRAKSASDGVDPSFEMRMRKIDRARQMTNARAMTFKSRPAHSKA